MLQTRTRRSRESRRERRRRVCVSEKRCTGNFAARTGHRFYNPDTGRWLNPDPIGENGCVNIFLFIYNDAIASIDLIGLRVGIALPRTIPGEWILPRPKPPATPPKTGMPPLYPPVPIVPIVPIPNPPTLVPDPTPGTQPSPDPGQGLLPPVKGGPPYPYGPSGDCTPDRQRFLQRQMKAICNLPSSCVPKKCPQNDPEEIYRRIKLNEDCVKARQGIMDECYRGGNDIHKDELQKAKNAL